MRLVKNVGESFSKIAGKKAETDSVSRGGGEREGWRDVWLKSLKRVSCLQWFDEQQQNFDVLDAHLKKLFAAIETMINCRRGIYN